jgi:hypothetical protein
LILRQACPCDSDLQTLCGSFQFLTFSASIAIAALPTLGRIIPPAPENVIPPPLVTALAVTSGNVPFYRSRITLLSDIARTPKDGVPTISVWIVRRNPLAPDIRRLHFRSINIAPQHCRAARVHVAALCACLRPLNLAHNPPMKEIYSSWL